jgi:RNA polymerase sigma-70 factor (ECF subfamily)
LYQEGSQEAFAALYARHSGKVYGYLKSRVAGDSQAVDLFQEVFVKIHRSKHLYNRSLPVLPWIFSVTHSVMIDGLRKSPRKREVYGTDFDEMPAPAESQKDRGRGVASLLKTLPAPQRRALEMRYVDEKTFDEIAASLKTSTLNVRQIVSRGVKRLKKQASGGQS